MMIATNWGVYEFGKREDQWREEGDPRDMQIRARSMVHLAALREHFPRLGETVFVGWGKTDFQYRVYITKAEMAVMMSQLVQGIDYVRFKEGALKDHKLHNVLSAFWTTLLRAYPEGSSYTAAKYVNRDDDNDYDVPRGPFNMAPRAKRLSWWEDAKERRRNGR